MNKLNLFSAKTAAIALTVLASLTMASNVQAHHNDEYLPLVPFILYNVLTEPQHYHSQHSHSHKRYQKSRRHNHRHEYHQRHRRNSHSHDGYSQKRLVKKHRRH